jgi:tRNA G10  N-methylase Trm11
VRYRLDFISKGHQRHAVQEVAAEAFKLCPAVINDARNATWAVDIHPTGRGVSVELRPRFSPDPRFSYRRQDVPAASHPPLAACMARMAGNSGSDVVWDPFCGSGLELIERVRLGGVTRVFGTDLSSEAIGIAKANLAEAKLDVSSKFVCCDFRDLAIREGLQPGSITQIITNPPLGRRVPIHDLNGLIDDLVTTAALMLRPGGRLVLANPLPIKKQIKSGLHLDSSQVVDFGGFDCRVESYTKRG